MKAGIYASFAIVLAVALTIAPPAVLAAAASAAPLLTALYADPKQPDFSGLWVVTAFNFTQGNVLPKLQGEYKTLFEKRDTAIKSGVAIDDDTASCLPSGMPHLLVVPYPFEIMQTPGRVTFLYEYDSVVRRVPLDANLKVDEDAVTFYGDSVGHWDKDTLVIETVNVRADTQLDSSGLPHSDVLKITERWHRKDATTLENRITLDDPKAYAEPFTVTKVYRSHPKWKISEYICEENNRNKPDAEGRTSSGVTAP
ncbi:MAG: hypothetical protein ABI645_13620 [Pseudomonadota bacterium]